LAPLRWRSLSLLVVTRKLLRPLRLLTLLRLLLLRPLRLPTRLLRLPTPLLRLLALLRPSLPSSNRCA
jgi:hypothetical protein